MKILKGLRKEFGSIRRNMEKNVGKREGYKKKKKRGFL